MKYKQRIVASFALPFLLTAILLSYIFIYSKSSHYMLIRRWRNSDFNIVILGQDDNLDLSPSPPVCQSEELFKNVTADYISNDLFEISNNDKYKRHGTWENSFYQKSFRNQKNSKPLTVIVVPHSHIDPGWIWTVDKYYNEKTRHILDNSVDFLSSHSDMTMLWVETMLLEKWWNENSEQKRMQLKLLIENGQFEVVSGGWISVDEAVTHYTAVLDQLIEGHRWLKETFNKFPETSWSLDPFGYSSSLPYLWKKSGMTGINVIRILQRVKNFMASKKMLTFSWRQPWDAKGKYDILTHAEPNVLFCIAESCGPDRRVCNRLDFYQRGDLPVSDSQPIEIERTFRAKNLEDFAEILVKQYRAKSWKYKHNVILSPHGCDFRYYHKEEFNQTYYNLKRVMKVINSKKAEWNVNIKFGTVKEYFRLIKQDTKENHENTIIGDFFPYSESLNIFWTGFFITRPFDKRMIRLLHELLRVTEMLTTFAIVESLKSSEGFPKPSDLKMLQDARRTSALMQHHDAITGTSTKVATEDYEMRMVKAMSDLQILYSRSQEKLFKVKSTLGNSSFLHTFEYSQFDKPLRRRIIQITNNGSKVIFSNSYSQTRVEIVSLIIETMNVVVEDPDHSPVDVQINPFWENNNKIADDLYEIFFEIKVPPFGIAVYTIKRATVSNHIATLTSGDKIVASDIVFKNSFLRATFSKNSGMLQKVCQEPQALSCTAVNLRWIKYKGSYNDAYVLRTSGIPEEIITRNVSVVTGKLLSQVIVGHDYFRHVVTVYNGNGIQSKNIHIDNIATLDSKYDQNIELMMELNTDIRNKDSKFYTDANGFQLIGRKPRFNFPTGGNFYPITSLVVLEDKRTRLAVHSAQPHGVGSFKTGNLQFMIDRVPPSSGKGLPEPVLDQKPAHSKFVIQLERVLSGVLANNTQGHKNMITLPSISNILVNDELQHPVISTVYKGNDNLSVTRLNFMKSALPCDVMFANFRNFIASNLTFAGTGITFHKKSFSCNFEGESSLCDKSGINLNNLFQSSASISSVTKMSLSHFYEEKVLDDINNIKIDAMEMESYLIKWA